MQSHGGGFTADVGMSDGVIVAGVLSADVFFAEAGVSK